ncbi:signal peptide peptidase-domain-containing protein [Chytridium lagenaria]|nr:signal peptide peptidase-domain-containing protein [Chytridium lagenaria]
MDSGTLYAYIALGVMAVIPIYVGSWASLKFPQKKSNKKHHKEDEPEFFSLNDAKWYPVVGSVTLFSLYIVLRFVSKEIINILLTANFVVLGIGSIYKSILICARYLSGFELVGDYSLVLSFKDDEVHGFHFGYLHIFLAVLSTAIGGVYAFTKHWILSNIHGEALSIIAIQLLNLDSFLTGIVLLSGLFFYDVFWVFGTEVMVTVAKGLDVPIKVVFPRNVTEVISQGILNKPTGVPFSMLGLGDIVIPGIFVALCLQYDHYRYLQTPAGKKDKHSRNFATPYFTTCFILYCLGLVTTVFVMHTFQAAQPALLYLSPACILAALGVALVRGEVDALFKFAPQGSPAAEANAAAAKKVKDSEDEASVAPTTPATPKRTTRRTAKMEDGKSAGEESDASVRVGAAASAGKRKGTPRKV